MNAAWRSALPVPQVNAVWHAVPREPATRLRFGRPLTLAAGVTVPAFSTARIWP